MESELALVAAALLVSLTFLLPGAGMAMALCMPMIHPGIGEGAAWLGSYSPGLVFAAALVRAIVTSGNKDQNALNVIDFSIIILVAYILISILFSSSQQASLDASGRIVYMALSFYVTTRLLCYSQGVGAFSRSLMIGFVIFGVFITGLALHLDQSASEFITRLTIGRTYIALANYITVALLSALYLVLYMGNATSPLIRTLTIPSIPFLFYGMLLCNTRGVVVALFLSITFLIVRSLTARRINRKLVYRGIVGLFISIAAGIVGALAYPETWVRMAREFTAIGDEGSDSEVVRVELFTNAYNMFLNNPILGEGVGTFEALNRTYPHNLVLESMADMGLIGLILLVVIMFGSFLLSTKFQSVAGLFISALLVLQIFESQVSLAFWMNKNLFVFIAMASALHLLHHGLPDPRMRTKKRKRVYV